MKRSLAIFALGIGLAAAAQARAATVQYSQHIQSTYQWVLGDSITNDVEHTWSIPGFDSSLGSLLRVRLDATTAYEFSVAFDTLTHDGLVVGDTIVASYAGGYVDVSPVSYWSELADFSFPRDAIEITRPHQVIGGYDSGLISRPALHLFNADPEILAAVTTMTPLQAYLFDDMNANPGECFAANGSLCPSITVRVQASHDVTFSYDYRPAAAPEPATWALLLMGWAGAGGVLRRRRAVGRRPA